MIAYHITLRRSVPNILARGVQPRIGPRAKEIGEVERAIFMYRTKKDCQDGLAGWFGDVFFDEELDDLVILEIQVGKDLLVRKEQESEFLVLDLIPETSIKKIWSRDFKSDVTDQFEPAVIVIPQSIADDLDEED